MKDNASTKMFARQFLRETKTADGYPLYRGRKPENGEITTLIEKHEAANR